MRNLMAQNGRALDDLHDAIGEMIEAANGRETMLQQKCSPQRVEIDDEKTCAERGITAPDRGPVAARTKSGGKDAEHADEQQRQRQRDHHPPMPEMPEGRKEEEQNGDLPRMALAARQTTRQHNQKESDDDAETASVHLDGERPAIQH